MKKLLLIPVLLSVLVVSAQVQVGDPVPDFTLIDSDGQSHSLHETLDEGKGVLLFFMASWLGPTLASPASMAQELYADYNMGEQCLDVWILSVDPGDNAATMDQIKFDYYLDAPGIAGADSVYNEMSPQLSIPWFLLVHPDRKAGYSVYGYSALIADTIRDLVEENAVVPIIQNMQVDSIGAETYQFSAITNCPHDLFWDFGDGDTSTSLSPVHTYTSTGSYTLGLTATNPCNDEFDLYTEDLTVMLSEIDESATPVELQTRSLPGALEVWSDARNSLVEVYDMQGNLLYAMKSVTRPSIHNIPLLPGMYIVQLHTNSGTFTRKSLIH